MSNRNLLGTQIIKGDLHRHHSEVEKSNRSLFIKIWLLAVVLAVPVGIMAGNIIGSTRMAQMQACLDKSRDFKMCAVKNL